jgi:hypothetical protein
LLSTEAASATVTHTLINGGLWPVELAPWAITQFRLGGTVIMPLPVGNADPDGLLPNRQISLWPYAHLNDPRLHLDDRFILFKAEAILPPFKLGYFNPHGWIGYWLDGVLFRKTFVAQWGRLHPDGNCNTEMYSNNQFAELESLGPLNTVRPGESVVHVETWELFESLDQPFLPADWQVKIRDL